MHRREKLPLLRSNHAATKCSRSRRSRLSYAAAATPRLFCHGLLPSLQEKLCGGACFAPLCTFYIDEAKCPG